MERDRGRHALPLCMGFRVPHLFHGVVPPMLGGIDEERGDFCLSVLRAEVLRGLRADKIPAVDITRR